MKYTETLFKMPVMIFDGIEMLRISKKEIEDDQYVSSPVQWARGFVRIPVDEIVSWVESWEKGKTIDDVIENGFDSTLVSTRTLGEYICTWKMEKFEAELDKHIDTLNSQLLNEVHFPTTQERSEELGKIMDDDNEK